MNTAIIRVESCFGDFACSDNSPDDEENVIEISSSSCRGFYACSMIETNIGINSCIGDYSCQLATAEIGNGSCLGLFSCFINSGPIANGSCRNDISTCDEVEGDCNTYLGACLSQSGEIGNGSW